MKRRQHLRKKQETQKYSVDGKYVPNTRPSLIISKQLQYENYRLDLHLVRVTRFVSPQKDTHSRDSSHQYSFVVTTFTTPVEHTKCVSTIDSPYLLCHKSSHRPTVLYYSCLTQTRDKTSSNSSQKKVASNLLTESPQGSTSPPM